MTREQEEKLFVRFVKANALFRDSSSISSIIEAFGEEEKVEISEEEKDVIIRKLLKLRSLIGRNPTDLYRVRDN
jgi:hypothetical protein